MVELLLKKTSANLFALLTPSNIPFFSFESKEKEMLKLLSNYMKPREIQICLFLAAIDGSTSSWEFLYKRLHPGIKVYHRKLISKRMDTRYCCYKKNRYKDSLFVSYEIYTASLNHNEDNYDDNLGYKNLIKANDETTYLNKIKTENSGEYKNPVQENISEVQSEMNNLPSKTNEEMKQILKENGIELQQILGAGNFGQVWKASFQNVKFFNDITELYRKLWL